MNVSQFWLTTRIVISTATVASDAVSPDRRISGTATTAPNTAATSPPVRTARIGVRCQSPNAPGRSGSWSRFWLGDMASTAVV